MENRSLISRLRAFGRNERGTFTIEAVMILPLLVWACLAILTYIDGFRTQITNARITYAMGDMLSRWQEDGGVDGTYLNGLRDVYEHLATGNDNTYMRVSSIIWDETNKEHILLWSQRRQTASLDYRPPSVSQGTVSEITDLIPPLADGDSVIVLETWLDYTPPFGVGISGRRFDNETVVSPRFVPKIEWD